ncbi:MAG: MBL fold metallo-hydrolase [bacterium]
MQNKIIYVGLAVALIAAMFGLYLTITGSNRIIEDHKNMADKLDKDFQRLFVRTGPYAYTGAPLGYVVEFENGVKFYVAGDTGISADMKLVVGDYYKPDVAILPIGNFFTMGSKEAAYATSLVNPKKYVIPAHYASYEFLTSNVDEFSAELGKYNLAAQSLALKIGEEKDVLGVKVVWLGHGSFLFESPSGKRILIDPAAKYSAAWPEEYRNLNGFGKVDMVLLTHAHPDHVITSDLEDIERLYGPIIFAQYEAGQWIEEHTSLEMIMSFMNAGANIGKEEIAKLGLPTEKMGDIRVYAVPAAHTSSATIQ